jgi:hypothetical protein
MPRAKRQKDERSHGEMETTKNLLTHKFHYWV